MTDTAADDPATAEAAEGMTHVQRRAVIALCFIVAATYLVSASMTFTLAPMMADLSMTSAQGDLAMAFPAIASLFIVFAAGRLGDRLGHRRVIVAMAIPFILGGLVVATAPNGTMVQVGMLLAGGTATAIQVISLGLLQKTFPSGPARVSAFTSFGMMFAAVYVVMPVVSGRIVELTTWRVVPMIWVVAGALIPVAALLLLAHPGPRQKVGELATPLLAGLVLACLVSNINRRSEDGSLVWTTAISLIVGVIALAVLLVLMRRLTNPSLSLAALRIPRMKPVLLAVAIVMCVNTLVYVTLGVQYLYDLSSVQAAWALIPAQLGAVVGAKVLAGQLMTKLGVARGGQVVLLAFAVTYLTLLLVQATSPMWLPIAAATLFAACGSAAITILNTAVMSRSPEGEQGLVSSYRGAASSIGGSLAVVLLGSGIVSAINAGSSSGTVDADALVSGLHADGVVAAVLLLCAFGVYVWTTRGTTDE